MLKQNNTFVKQNLKNFTKDKVDGCGYLLLFYTKTSKWILLKFGTEIDYEEMDYKEKK